MIKVSTSVEEISFIYIVPISQVFIPTFSFIPHL